MLKIRLKRHGRKKYALYRIIVIDSTKRREGKAIEEVGFYNPFTKETRLNLYRIDKKIQEGAQLTHTVHYLIKNCKHKYDNLT